MFPLHLLLIKVPYSEKYILNLRKEALKSHKHLGVKQTYFYEFPAPFLDQYPIAKISDSIKKIITKIKPIKLFRLFFICLMMFLL